MAQPLKYFMWDFEKTSSGRSFRKYKWKTFMIEMEQMEVVVRKEVQLHGPLTEVNNQKGKQKLK